MLRDGSSGRFVKDKSIEGRICAACDSNTTRLNEYKNPCWRNHDGYWLCSKCYNVYVLNPVYNPIHIPTSNKRRMKFKDKIIHLKINPRKGVCQVCLKKVGEVKRTNIHHIQYHDNDPLKDTVELCNSCHRMADIERHTHLT